MILKSAQTSAAVAALAAALTLFSTVSASGAPAAPVATSPDAAQVVESSMTITSYDRSAAEAHGYRIVTDASGRETSMPVTTEAQADEALASRVEKKEGRTTVTGGCGQASLTTKPISSLGRIAISTSYSLSGGRKSFGHLWKVDGTSRLGQPFTESFSGANNFDSRWSATHSISLYGFSHGTNSLHLTNHAKLTNGGICTAKIVINSW